METRRVENTPSHDAGKDIDVNNVNCSSSAASAVDGPAASFDVNNNTDSKDLSPVNNKSFTGSVTAANGGPNTFSDLNVNAFSGTARAHLNVNSSCSKVTAAVNTHCDSNIDANSSSNKTATANSSEDVHSISKTVDIETTANSGVNVNLLCESNIEVNSTSNKSAPETSCGNVHSVSKIVNVEATANSGDSSSNVNVDAETTENGGVGANISNDKAIDKGTVDSGAPLNEDVDLNNIDMLPDDNLNDSTFVTEVLSFGRAGPVPGECEVFLDIDASLEAGLFSPDGEISECSLNDAQILPSSS
ncbi:mucin-21-like [Acropora muricata]|uniref:mucin-21-like n=1 Tax=Acropora muricata TaxID=159855 RepID=UPI0034E3C23D